MSSSLCFSAAETLRCAGLTRQQSLFLLVPALIEGVVGLPLLYFKHRKGKLYWLFVAECFFYAGLAVMDYLSHTSASDVSQLRLFKALDITVGALAAIPTLCYTLFLYLFAKRNLLPLLSRSWSTIISRTLLISIPLMLTSNTISSFIGVSYTPVQLRNGRVTLGIGFLTNGGLTPWTFMSNTSLAIATAYQAIHFCLAFLHFFQRAYRPDRASITSEHDPRLYAKRGTGWLAFGLKLGAIEAVVGFAGFAFGPSLARRCLRAASRVFMVAGVCVSGDDDVGTEGFTMFDDEKARPSIKRKKGQDLRDLIGKPQLNTFRHVEAGTDRGSQSPFSDANSAELGRARGPRVTIHFDNDKTPRLEMRLSNFDVLSSELQLSSASSSMAMYTGYAPPVPIIQAPPRARRRANTEDSVFATVKQLAPQFPQTPTGGPIRSGTLPPESIYSQMTPTTGDLTRKLSRRKPAPVASPATLAGTSPPWAQMPVSRLRVRTDSTVLVTDPSRPMSGFVTSPYLPQDGTQDYEPSTPSSGRSRSTTTSGSLFTVPPTTSRRARSNSPDARRGPFADRHGSMSSGMLLDQTPGDATPTIILSAAGDTVYRHQVDFGFAIEEEELSPDSVAGGRRRRTPEVPMSVSYDVDSPEASSVRSPSTTMDPKTKVLRMKTAPVRSRPAVRAGDHQQAASLSAQSALGPFADPSSSPSSSLEDDEFDEDPRELAHPPVASVSAMDRARIPQRYADPNPFA